MRGDELPPLHGLPIGIKDLQDTAGLRTTYGSPIFRDHVPASDERAGRARCAQPARIVIGKTNTPEFGAGANTRNAVYGATGNPFDPDALGRRLLGRLGGGAGHRHGAALLRLRHRRLAAQSGRVLRHRRLPSDAGPGRQRAARARLEQPVGAGPMARTVRGPVPAALRHGLSDDARDPLADDGAWPPCAPAGGLRGAARASTCRALRVALHAGFRLRTDRAHIAEVFADKTASLLSRRCSRRAEDATPDCAGADEAFEVLRAVGLPGQPSRKTANAPAGLLGPNVRANVEEGLRYIRRRCRAGRSRCRPRCTAAGRRSSATRRVLISPPSPSARAPGASFTRRRSTAADPHLLPLAGARLRA